jgi:hypothetical protein
MEIEELKKFLEENGYKLRYVRHLKNQDVIRIDKNNFYIVIRLKKHIEDVPLEVISKYLVVKR